MIHGRKSLLHTRADAGQSNYKCKICISHHSSTHQTPSIILFINKKILLLKANQYSSFRYIMIFLHSLPKIKYTKENINFQKTI